MTQKTLETYQTPITGAEFSAGIEHAIPLTDLAGRAAEKTVMRRRMLRPLGGLDRLIALQFAPVEIQFTTDARHDRDDIDYDPTVGLVLGWSSHDFKGHQVRNQRVERWDPSGRLMLNGNNSSDEPGDAVEDPAANIQAYFVSRQIAEQVVSRRDPIRTQTLLVQTAVLFGLRDFTQN